MSRANPLRYFQRLPTDSAGIIAVALSIYFIGAHISSPTIVAASLFFLLACITDTLQSRIPNLLTIILLCVGIALNVATSGWPGLLFSLQGTLLGFALLFLPYSMGGFGAGDLKALSALGALVGPVDLLHVFVYMALYGGGLAVLHIVIRSELICRRRALAKPARRSTSPPRRKYRQSKTFRFPYACAIAFGYYTFIVRGVVI